MLQSLHLEYGELFPAEVGRSEIADSSIRNIHYSLQNLLTPDLFIFGPIFLVAFVLTLLVNFFFGLTPAGRRRVG